MRRLLGCALLALVPAGAANALDCGSTATQDALDQCAGQEFQRADAALNDAYRQVAAGLRGDAEANKLLVTAQRAWIRFRDADCEFSSSGVRGGSIHPMIETECKTELTMQRTKTLQSWLHCAEGDLGCP